MTDVVNRPVTGPVTGPASGPVARVDPWEQTLSDYSAALDEHRQILLGVEADVLADVEAPAAPTFTPSAGLGEIPGALKPWACTLLDTTEGLMQLAKDLAVRSERQRAGRAVQSPVRSSLRAPVAGDSTLDAFL